MRKNILFVILLFLVSGLQAQERSVSGKIVAFNTYSLNNVKISARKAKTWVFTDSTGIFQIYCNKKDVIKIQAEGFLQQTVKLDKGNTINTNMIYLDNNWAYKTALANQYISQEDLDYAIENLMQENNDFSRYQSIYDLIQAKYPLTRVIEERGFKRIYLTSKGPNSLEAGSYALIVVDGIATENISSIVPSQVANVKVHTDTETSMYGTRGGNGVVEIELKH